MATTWQAASLAMRVIGIAYAAANLTPEIANEVVAGALGAEKANNHDKKHVPSTGLTISPVSSTRLHIRVRTIRIAAGSCVSSVSML